MKLESKTPAARSAGVAPLRHLPVVAQCGARLRPQATRGQRCVAQARRPVDAGCSRNPREHDLQGQVRPCCKRLPCDQMRRPSKSHRSALLTGMAADRADLRPSLWCSVQVRRGRSPAGRMAPRHWIAMPVAAPDLRCCRECAGSKLPHRRRTDTAVRPLSDFVPVDCH
jgi:hypothetical protein